MAIQSWGIGHYSKSFALPDINKPTISPNSPNTELKISITRIFTNLKAVVSIAKSEADLID